MPRRILLVDDHLAEISAVKRVVSRAGDQPVLATNASDAVASLEQALPDAVLLAPDCDSGEAAALAQRLAADERTRCVPLVLLGAEVAGVAARAVPRPVEPAALESALRAALAGPRLEAGAAFDAAPPPAAPSGAEEIAEELPISIYDAGAEGPPVPSVQSSPEVGSLRQAGLELQRLSERIEAEQRRRVEEVARLAERAAAEEDAAEQLRLAREAADRERPAAPAPAPAAPPAARPDAAASAEAARRHVLAFARERAAAAAARLAAEPPEAIPPELSNGSLAAVSMPRLLALAARAGATGRLEVDTDPPRSLWLEQGRLVGAASAAADERVEEIALRLGLLTREQHRLAAPALAGLASRRACVALLERGFLKPAELAMLARRRAEEIACATFTADAAYRFHPGAAVPADERLSLERGTLALALDGVRRRWTRARLDRALGGAATLLAPAPRPPPASELALSPAEERVAALADGLRTLEEILADAPLGALAARQALAGLVEVGRLVVKVLAPPEAAVPSSSAIDLARVEERLEQVRTADYFSILGVARACTPYEVREAAERLLSELTPGRFEAAATGALEVKLAEIRQVVEEARDVLADDELRAEYLAAVERTP